MLYALDEHEVSQVRNKLAATNGYFTGAEILSAVYLTDEQVVAKILPKPLKPIGQPLVYAFVAHYPQTNFGCVYNEGGIFILAAYGNEIGSYCISMPVDDDMAMIYGRENYGYPKKIAENISLERGENKIVGSVNRKGVEILRIELEPKTTINNPPSSADPNFLFKFFQSPDNRNFDYAPRLVRQVLEFEPCSGRMEGEGRVIVRSSPYDPLGEIPIRSVVSCYYGFSNITMQPGEVVCEDQNVSDFLPHAFFKTDLVGFLNNTNQI